MASVFNNLASGIQRAFFDSLDRAGCLQLDTEGPDSDEGSEGEEEEDRSDEEDQESDEESGEVSEGEEEEDELESRLRDVEMTSFALLGASIIGKVIGFGKCPSQHPLPDKLMVEGVHHLEVWCDDALDAANKFSSGLGMPYVAKSDFSTGNPLHASYVLRSGDVTLCFTAPQSFTSPATSSAFPRVPFPSFQQVTAQAFLRKHGTGVRAVAVQVRDVVEAYATSIRHGARGVAEPLEVADASTGSSFWSAEVSLLDDVVLRFIKTSGNAGQFLAHFVPESSAVKPCGLTRVDHVTGAVSELSSALEYITTFTGFRSLDDSAFQGEQVGEGKSRALGRYSVLSNNTESVFLPIVSPQAEDSHVQCFLDSNNGPGIQHLAFSCTDLVQTVQELKARSKAGMGLAIRAAPSPAYYADLKLRLGHKLTQEQLETFEQLGILVDEDDTGILLQALVQPWADTQSFSVELVQRISPQGGEKSASVGCGCLVERGA